LAFALQKLLTQEATILPTMARLGEELPTEEQRNCSATVKCLGDDKDVIRG
jgi:hypothetical protein